MHKAAFLAFEMLMLEIDHARNETIMQCTPALAPKLKTVLDPPDEQLRDETRAELMSLVAALQAS